MQNKISRNFMSTQLPLNWLGKLASDNPQLNTLIPYLIHIPLDLHLSSHLLQMVPLDEQKINGNKYKNIVLLLTNRVSFNYSGKPESPQFSSGPSGNPSFLVRNKQSWIRWVAQLLCLKIIGVSLFPTTNLSIKWKPQCGEPTFFFRQVKSLTKTALP